MSLEPVGDLELEGFNRLNPAGDERHLLVSTGGKFQALDLGTWAEAHGDHSHYWTAEPTLTDVAYDAVEPGHVVVHEGRTALFDDGTGQVRVIDSEHIADADAAAREYTTPSPHHGVAVELTDDTLVVSEGTEEARTGIRVLDGDGEEIAASLERPTRVSLIDTRNGKLELVELPSSYTFRSLARGDDGEALVLGTDGQVHVIDPESAKVTKSIPVIDEWEEPIEWQDGSRQTSASRRTS